MKTKTILSFVVAALVALLAVSFAMAVPIASDMQVSINDVEMDENSIATLAASPGETVPMLVTFTALEDFQDLKVKAWIDGYSSDISASTSKFDVLNGSTYVKRLSLTLPGVHDMDNLDEALTVYVRISNKNTNEETQYEIRLQRDSQVYEILSVDAPSRVSAGEVMALNVVIENTGARELKDTFVTVSIPELGISKRTYFGDLDATDTCTDDCNLEDAKERNIFLVIPSDAVTGSYTMEVRASNYGTTSVVRRTIYVSGISANATNNNSGNVIDVAGNDDEGIPTSIIVLTVVLAIIFVVLLVVLIVLLTKKPEKSEDFGETSYY